MRRICVHCKVPFTPPPDALDIAGVEVEDREHVQFFTGEGCGQCEDGYRGRTGVHELLTIDDEIRDMVLRSAPSHEIREYAINEQNMVTLKGDAIAKVLQGVTTLDEALTSTQNE